MVYLRVVERLSAFATIAARHLFLFDIIFIIFLFCVSLISNENIYFF